ncbi:L-lactate permease [Candidatus Harpocratesius sp.]
MSVLLDVILILVPFILAVFFLIYFKLKAHVVGIILFIMLFVLSLTVFKTDWRISLIVSIAGIVKSFPISLMVLTSILMMTLMEKTGALQKLVVNFKKLGGGNQAFQIMFINLALGTFLVSIGATPVTMLPPVLAAMGYSAFAAVALPSIGYDPLCTFALLAVPAVFFAEFMGIPLQEAGFVFSVFMPLVTLGIAFGMLWLAGGKKLLFSKDGIIFSLVGSLTAGGTTIITNYFGIVTLTGVIAGLTTAGMLVLVAKIRNIKIIDSSVLTEEEKRIDDSMSLIKALSPWILLILFAIITNLITPIFDFLHSTLALPIKFQNITVNTSVFAHAYFWVLISTLLSMIFLHPTRDQLKTSAKIWINRSLKPVFAACIFFAVAFIFIYSGNTYNGGDWIKDPAENMVSVLATASAQTFGTFYPLVVPFIGLFGGFLSGSETSAIAMFTSYHAETAISLGINGKVLGAANGIGGGLASVISPAKIQNAAATIDEMGIEGEVVKKTAPIALLMTLSVALLAWCWANSFKLWAWFVIFGAFSIGIGLLFWRLSKK